MGSSLRKPGIGKSTGVREGPAVLSAMKTMKTSLGSCHLAASPPPRPLPCVFKILSSTALYSVPRAAMGPVLGAPERTRRRTIPCNYKQAGSSAQGGEGPDPRHRGAPPTRGRPRRLPWGHNLPKLPLFMSVSKQHLSCWPALSSLSCGVLRSCQNRIPLCRITRALPHNSCPARPRPPPTSSAPPSAPWNGPLRAEVSLADGAQPARPLSPAAEGWLCA